MSSNDLGERIRRQRLAQEQRAAAIRDANPVVHHHHHNHTEPREEKSFLQSAGETALGVGAAIILFGG